MDLSKAFDCLPHKLLRNLIIDAKTLDDKNAVHGEKSDFLGQLTEKIRGCGVSFYIWTNRLNTNKRLSTNTKVILDDIFLQIL
jgi:hypothetical protein